MAESKPRAYRVCGERFGIIRVLRARVRVLELMGLGVTLNYHNFFVGY